MSQYSSVAWFQLFGNMRKCYDIRGEEGKQEN
jgi:hypothetical protein